MLNPNWSPKDLVGIKKQAEDLKLKIKPGLPIDEVVRMQL